MDETGTHKKCSESQTLNAKNNAKIHTLVKKKHTLPLIILGILLCIGFVVLCSLLIAGNATSKSGESSDEYAPDSVYYTSKMSTKDLHEAATYASTSAGDATNERTNVLGDATDGQSATQATLATTLQASSNTTQSTENSIGTTVKDTNNNTVCTLRDGGTITYASNTVLMSVPSDTPQSEIDEIFESAGQKVIAKSVVSNTLIDGETLLEVAYTGANTTTGEGAPGAGADASNANEGVVDTNATANANTADAYDLSKALSANDIVIDSTPNYVETLCDTQTDDTDENATVSVSATATVSGANSASTAATTAADTTADMPASASDTTATASSPTATLETTSINDTERGGLWYLNTTKAYDAWDVARASGKVTVAVVDSGVDYTHEDLKNNLVNSEFAKNTYSDKTGAEAVEDTEGHGTHVSGIIAATADNSTGVAGITYNANVLPIRSSYDATSSYMSDIIEGVEYAVKLKTTSTEEWAKNIRVINLSLGGWHESLSYAQQSINKAHDAGIVVVAAAGNNKCGDVNPDYESTYRHYPSSYDNVICVSSVKLSNYVWDGGSDCWYNSDSEFASEYSNYGSKVDIAAPGTRIKSTIPSNNYAYYSGTSMSAPMVSGAAALLFSQVMTATPDKIESILESTATDLGDTGRDDYYGNGLLNLSAAVNTLKSCAAGNHAQLESDVEVAPTCTEKGLSGGIHCNICGTVSEEQTTIPALGHLFESKNAIVHAPTCTESGYTQHKCSRCEYSEKDTYTNALGHSYKSTVTAATCVAQGYTTHTCERCSDSYIDTYTAKTDHTYSSWAVIQAGTCTKDQIEISTCSVCGKSQTKTIAAKGHTPVYEDLVPATCTTDGHSASSHCGVCGEVLEGATTIPATGHTEVADVAVEPTCTEGGLTEGSHCSVCNKVLKAQETVAAKGHTIVEDAAVEATCTATGLSSGTHCVVCNKVLKAQETVAKVAHKWLAWAREIRKNASGEEEDDEVRTCSVCGTEEVKVLASAISGSDAVKVYRLYNTNTSEHLFTTGEDEYNSLKREYETYGSGWKGEGVSWYSPSKSSVGVYRLYCDGLGAAGKMSHHYTTSKEEADGLVKNHGWQYDNNANPIFYSAVGYSGSPAGSAVACYRLYHDGLSAHHYTQSLEETNGLVANNGWAYEDIGFYVWAEKPE